MHFDELRAEVDLHLRLVGADADVLAQIAIGHRVERVGDLNVMIGMDLRSRDPRRHVEGRFGRREHRRLLDRLEHLAWDATGGAVHARASDLAAPVLGAAACVVQVDEGLAVEPALTHVRHLILDARLVLRRTDASRVHEDAAGLHVVGERVEECGVEGVRRFYDRLHVVGDHRVTHCTEKPPRTIEAFAYGFGRLTKRRPDELVAAEAKRHDQHPELAQLALVVDQATHLPEVDLRLLSWRRIVDSHRLGLLAPPELLRSETPERVVARTYSVIAHQQRVDLAQTERSCPRVASEPELDALAVLRDLVPLDARRHQGPRLHALRDTVHLFVCERPAANQSETLGRIRVSCNGLAVDSRLATDPSIFLPRRPAAQHFLHVDHR